MTSIFVTQLDNSQILLLEKLLSSKNFDFSHPPHTLFQAKAPGITCTVYASHKLTVQGKNMKEFIEFSLEPEILKAPLYTAKTELALETIDRRSRIGTDEAGKGDYFGPLCVAGVMATEKDLPLLLSLGVQDSKNLSDAQVTHLAKKIVENLPNYVIRLRPEKYNSLYDSFGNLNSLLAWCHASVIETLSAKTEATVAIVDKFAHESLVERALRKKKTSIPVEQRVRGEADIVVAAASIVARWAFLEGIKETGALFNTHLPKGASQKVKEKAREFVKEYGKEALKSVAKIHFKTTQEL